MNVALLEHATGQFRLPYVTTANALALGAGNVQPAEHRGSRIP